MYVISIIFSSSFLEGLCALWIHVRAWYVLKTVSTLCVRVYQRNAITTRVAREPELAIN